MAEQAAVRLAAKYTVEIGDEENRSVLWPITKEKLRGWWKRANVAGKALSQQFAVFPDLPGLVLVLDVAAKTFSINDPLNEPGNQNTIDQANAVLQSIHGTRDQRRVYRPQENVTRPIRNETDLKSSLYWMARLVEAKLAVVTGPPLPSMAEIERLPGKTMTECWDDMNPGRFREEPTRSAEG